MSSNELPKITYLNPYREVCQLCQGRKLIFVLRIPSPNGVTTLKMCQNCFGVLTNVTLEISGLTGKKE